jgi:carboxyl-terminal processing protease
MKKVKLIITIVCIIFFSAKYTYAQQEPAQNDFEISKNLDIFINAYKQLNTNYVDDINPGQMIKTALDAMLESLDPYTVYIPESDIEDYRFMTTGQYGGIGAIIYKRDSYIYISEPYENAPADKAGLKAGDKILEINGKSAQNKTVDEVSTALKGQPGTEIVLLVQRDSTEKPVEKTITREEITITNVPYSGFVSKDIGYINLSEFRQNAAKEVKEAFVKLAENKDMKGVILDLRGNGGGLLNEAVSIVNIFVDKGQLVCSTKGKIKDKNNVHRTQGIPFDTKIPFIVLVDGSSASASEIVAGSIQDLDRGIIIGQRTFGKGLVQNIVPLSYNSQMKVTIAKYYIPSGRCVQAVDYFNKDDNGKAPHIPDSLLKPFKTKAGRTVMEGSGIDPDIEVVLPDYKDITLSLMSKNLFFDFAVWFNKHHPSIAPAASFAITDDIFDEFTKFLKGKDYSYTTESEKALEDFKEKAIADNYFEDVKDQYKMLHDKIINEKKSDLLDNKAEISRVLRVFIVPLYYYQKGRIESSLSDDMDVAKAIEIFNSPTLYNSYLSSSYVKPETKKSTKQ